MKSAILKIWTVFETLMNALCMIDIVINHKLFLCAQQNVNPLYRSQKTCISNIYATPTFLEMKFRSFKIYYVSKNKYKSA